MAHSLCNYYRIYERLAMKTKTLIIATILFIAFRLDAKAAPGISIGMFYDSLQPYGEWIQLDGGVTVWHPNNVGPDWRPYSMGRWYWSDSGWYWDSDEPFGWATYHYGRWYYDDYYGWLWIPDEQWGPSWVEWRYNDDYIGWAPLPPYASFRINLGIHFSISWHSGYRYWNFVNYNHFCNHRVNAYLVDGYRVQRFFNTTRYRTNYYSDHDRIINGGIDRSFVERRMGSRIDERQIRDVNNINEFNRYRSESGDRIISYRPEQNNLSRQRDINNYEIRRGESRSSLQRDKIYSERQMQTDRNSSIGGNRNYTEERNYNYDRNNNNKPERNVLPERNTNYNRSWREQNQNNRVEKEIMRERPQNIERPQPNYNRQNYQQRESSPRREQVDRPSRSYERPRNESRERSNSGRENRGDTGRRR